MEISSLTGHPAVTRRRLEFICELKKNKVMFFMMSPGILFFIIFNYLPMFGIVLAFKNYNYDKGFFGSEWVGLTNFKFLFATEDAYIITRNTVLYNLVFIFLGSILAAAVAIMLNELRNRYLAKFYQSCMFLPYFLSWVVVSYLVYAFLSVTHGFVNSMLINVFDSQPINWYSEPKYWPFILTGANFWKNIGCSSVIYLATIVGIEQELYEAAEVDGATKWQQIKAITIPQLSTVMSILILMSLGGIFNSDFGLFFQVPLGSGALFNATGVINTYVYTALVSRGDIGMSSAAGFYQSVVGFVLVLLSNLLVKKVDDSKSLF